MSRSRQWPAMAGTSPGIMSGGTDIGRTERVLGPELAFPLRHHGGRERIADHVGGAAAHVEEGVDAHDHQQARPRGCRTGDSVAAITTSEARGTPATPLEVIIRVASIASCVPSDMSMW